MAEIGLAWPVQIAERNVPSVFDVNKEPTPASEPEKKKLPEPEIVSKWTLVDYDKEEAPADTECVCLPLYGSPAGSVDPLQYLLKLDSLA